MEIHQLQYVLAVAKYRNFTRAADENNVSQSTVSQQISKLEDELKVRLFDRTTRVIRLTAAGGDFISIAEQILTDIERSRRLMQQYADLNKGKLVIGTLPIVGHLGLTSLIASFQKMYPGIELSFREAGSKDLINYLYNFEIDIAIATPPSASEMKQPLEIYPLICDEIVLITGMFHPFISKTEINLSDARNEKFLCMKASFGMRSICDEACLQAGFDPTIIYESSQIDTICGLVSEGLGVALLTSRVAKSFSKSAIHIIRITPYIERITALIVPRRDYVSATVDAFQNFASDWIPQDSPEIIFKISKDS